MCKEVYRRWVCGCIGEWMRRDKCKFYQEKHILITGGAPLSDDRVLLAALECETRSGRSYFQMERKCDLCRRLYAEQVISGYYGRLREEFGEGFGKI